MRIRSLLIDDEAKSLQTLEGLITEFCPGVEIAGKALDIQTARTLILQENVDAIFLDINMSAGSGFELLKSFDEINFEVIFVTAYSEYALQAIKSCALDYLLKPINIKDLQNAVEKLRSRIIKARSENYLKEFLTHYSGPGIPTKIAIPKADGLTFVNIKDVIKLKAEGSYTFITLLGGKEHLSTRHLKEYEDVLPGSQFIRIHHSYIINMDAVIEYQKGEGGIVTLCDNSQIIVSRRKKQNLLERFSVYFNR